MKKLFLNLILAILTISCASSNNTTDVEKVHFYDKNGNTIQLSELYNILDNHLIEQNINGKIVKSEVKEFKHIKSNKIVLIGYTNDRNLNIGAELTEFKNGFKLNNHFIICSNCNTLNDEMNIDYKDEFLICKSNNNSDCIKHSIATGEN